MFKLTLKNWITIQGIIKQEILSKCMKNRPSKMHQEK